MSSALIFTFLFLLSNHIERIESIIRTSTHRYRRHIQGHMSKNTDYLASKALIKLLRHDACKEALFIRPDGFVLLNDCLAVESINKYNINTEDVVRFVSKCKKQRMDLLEGDDGQLWIRANQGHSEGLKKAIDSDSLLTAIRDVNDIPNICVHGTTQSNLESILANGLSRMSRVHIHFAIGLPTDKTVISGIRNNADVYIYLNIRKAMEAGMVFYLSSNNVILTEGFNGIVPPEYFLKIEKREEVCPPTTIVESTAKP